VPRTPERLVGGSLARGNLVGGSLAEGSLRCRAFLLRGHSTLAAVGQALFSGRMIHRTLAVAVALLVAMGAFVDRTASVVEGAPEGRAEFAGILLSSVMGRRSLRNGQP
jgi:hypothetical protein